MKRRFVLLWVASLVMAMASPALGGPDSSEPIADGWLETAQPVELNEAQLQDLRTIAEEEGLPLEEAIERFGWHEPFSVLVDDIRQAYPDSFAGARILPEGDPWIAFKSEVPAEAQALIDHFETIEFGGYLLTVEVIEARGFSEEELVARLVEAHYAVFEQRSIVANAASGYDLETGAITVEIEPVARPSNGMETAVLIAEVKGAAPAVLEGIDVQVVDKLPLGLETVYGGHSQTAGTSGFAVTWGSTRGLATCGHCDPPNKYLPNITLSSMGSHEGAWGDFRWNVTTHYEDDRFYSGSYHTNLRDVASIGFPTEGQRLCMNGKTSGKRCDDVFRTNKCSGGVCRLVVMVNHVSAPGDSGGPWFWGTRAYGIHHGGPWIEGKNRSAFSSVVNIDEALGVYIATS